MSMSEQTQIKYTNIKWGRAVTRKAIDLIEAGVPSHEAEWRAIEIMSNKRREKNADKSGG